MPPQGAMDRQVDGAERAAAAAARGDATTMLSRSELSERQLTERLTRKGHRSTAVSAAIGALRESGLQSDRRCAEVLTREHTLRGRGPDRIRHDLRRRGLDEGLIADCLRETGHDFDRLARETLRKRYGGTAPANLAEKEKRRAFLYRRGFTHDQIRAALAADDDPS